jgi:DNA invertase Pin-like site-specific DNA recombinase
MKYGYARCSTNESKQDITRQTHELQAFGVDEQNIFFEYESGTKADRAQLQRLLATVKAGDTIIATEVSRITRSTKQLCDIIDFAKEHRIKLIIGNSMTIDCSNGELDAMSKAFVQMSGVFAELERNMIVDRVKSGMANAKAKGQQLGRHKTTKEDIPATFIKYYNQFKDKKLNIAELSRLSCVSRMTAYKYIELLSE